MKKLCYYFLLVLLTVFLSITTAQALPLLDYGNADPYVGTFAASQYDYEDINAAVNDWNNIKSPPALPLLPDNDFDYIPGPYPEDYEPINLTWEGDYDYLTVKYATLVDLFYVAGLTSLTWENVYQAKMDDFPLNALSHARLWNGTPVPEPSTILLLGFGLVGLASLGRKKIKS